MIVLAVDPSVASPGAALFGDGILIAADRFSPSRPVGLESRGRRARRVAKMIFHWLPAYTASVDVLVYEWPQVYTAKKSKGDPNDLIALAAVGAALAGLLDGQLVEEHTPTPAEWTGGVPKVTRGNPWRSPRGARVAARLSAAERALVPDSHDAIDSVGLGLWYLGRFERARVFPGAT